VVFSAYDNGFEGTLGPQLKAGMEFDEIDASLIENLEAPTSVDLQKLAAQYADVLILGEENTQEVAEYAKSIGVEVVDGTSFMEHPEEAIKVYESLLVETDAE